MGVGALDRTGAYTAIPPVLDTLVTLPPKARALHEGLQTILESIKAQTGQAVDIGPVVIMGMQAPTSVSGEQLPARELIAAMFAEAQPRYVWGLLHEANSDEWGFNVRAIEPLPSAPPPHDGAGPEGGP